MVIRTLTNLTILIKVTIVNTNLSGLITLEV